MNEKALKIISLIANNGGEARFVGGYVRDMLINRATKDVDIACNLEPEKVSRILEENNITVIPTGINFGTVTALYQGETFEITSLRKDIETDGRHARVIYTKDWQEDAARRDFTFNALYLSASGDLYDYYNGVEDLKNGMVRFIGNPSERIQEDYLRILRLFRFHVLFGDGPIMPEALSAAESLKSGLANISGERIRTEMLKILDQKNQLSVLETMLQAGILKAITTLEDGDFKLSYLNDLLSDDIFTGKAINPITSLILLLNDAIAEEKIERLAARWRFSNKEKNLMLRLRVSLQLDLSNDYNVRRSLRLNSKDEFIEYIFLNYFKGKIDKHAALALKQFAETATIPEFPLSGQLLIEQGFAPGKELGRKLKQAEQYWEEHNYAPNAEGLLRYINEN